MTINIDLGDKAPGHFLYQGVATVTRDVRSSLAKVWRVGIRVTFETEPNDKNPKRRSFELVMPNSCSLRPDDYSVRIQQMLLDHAIEPKQPVVGDEDGRPT